jgi:hypothetical protein
MTFSALPVGANGEVATQWGADLRVIHIPYEAHLVGHMARLFAADPGIPSKVEETQSLRPTDSGLLPNYPNPFNATTLLRYRVDTERRVQLEIFDVAGQRLRRLVDRVQSRGQYEVAWDATSDNGGDVGTGSYLARLQLGDISQSCKLALIR